MSSIVSPCAWRRAIEWLGRLAVCLMVCGAAPARAQLTDAYRIQPTDVIIIDVVNEPQLAAKEFRVGSNGQVSYPFVGALKVASRTTAEVQEEVKRLLEADYLVNAQVLVQVKEFRRQTVMVVGAVTNQGLKDIPAERKWTVFEAISAAGGFTRLARTSDIQLTRQGRNEPMRFTQEELRNPDKAVFVEPGDIIFVPESRI